MNSRERVLTTLQHQEPDRVPIDCGAMRSTGMTALAYHHLKQHLGLTEGYIRVYDVMQQLAEIEPVILQHFEVDVVDIVNTSLCPDPRPWQPYTLPDGTPAEVPPDAWLEPDGQGGLLAKNPDGTVWGQMPKGCLYFEMIQPPLGAPREPVSSYKLPKYSADQLAWLRQRAQALYEKTDFALMGGFGGNILENGQFMRGWGNFMMDLGEGDTYVTDFINHLVEQHLENLDAYLDAVGPYIQLIQMGDDMGTQAGPQLSLDMFRKFILPAQAKVYAFAKKKCPHVALFLHSCGSIEIYLNDLIEAGVEVLNPVQTSAKNMDPVHLKQTYGDRLTFWGGGCDTQVILPHSTPEDIDRHVRERMHIFAPGGGYVFTTIHNVQADVPSANVAAVYEAAKKYRHYPIR